MLIGFGDIPAGATTMGRWNMETTLSGKFTEFSASYIHADEFGGQLTSLIDGNPQTHLLVRDVRVDRAGRDAVRDFLTLDTDIYRVYESDGTDTEVTDHSANSILQYAGSNGQQVSYDLTTPSYAGFGFARLSDPQNGAKAIEEVVRSDGKRLPMDNAWTSKTRDQNNNWEYWINFFDTDSTGSYTVVMGILVTGPRPPVMQFIPNRTSFEGNPISFLVEASDPDGTIPQLSAAPLPFGAGFIDQENGKGIFSWTPALGQAGQYTINFIASDGTLQASRSATIRVNSATDIDGDGMDDAWELEHFGTLERDGTEDFDGDGRSDLDEFQQQSDPTVTDGPDAPRIKSPFFNTETNQLLPTLEIYNVPSPDGTTLSYAFEVYSDEGMTIPVATAANVTEGVGTTLWIPGSALEDNHWYHWRVRAFDGTYYSLWTEGRFFLNTANDAPLSPIPDHPVDGAQVYAARPLLRVLNTDDPDEDGLSYVFRVALDNGMTNLVAESTAIPEGTAETTEWQLNTDIQEGVVYYWQVVVSDDQGAQAASPVRWLALSAANQVPHAPTISVPAVDGELSSQTVDLVVDNSFDADGDTLTYYFELDTEATFSGPDKRISGPVPEGVTTTSWNAAGLDDDRWYHWRAKAADGSAESPWVYGRFFVNTGNEAPAVPVPANPGDRAWVKTGQPRIEVRPAQDPDGDLLSYEFELYADNLLSELVETGTGNSRIWTPAVPLNSNNTYYWRAQVVDAHGLPSGWSGAIEFFVNDDGINDTPLIEFLEPVDTATAEGNAVTLRWHDDDPDSDAQIVLYYDVDGSGADGILITGGIDENVDGAGDIFQWDISFLPTGTYHIYAVITDATSSSTVYAPGTVTKQTAGIQVDAVSSDTTETGGTAALNVVLSYPPTGLVALNITSSDTTEGTVLPSLHPVIGTSYKRSWLSGWMTMRSMAM